MPVSKCLAILATAASLMISTVASAGVVTRTFVIDPALSSYTISGTATDLTGNSYPLIEQSPSSMTASLAGTFTVQYELGGTFEIVSSAIESLEGGAFQPLGTPATVAYNATTPAGTFLGAHRDFSYVDSGITALSSAGAFAAGDLQYSFGSGHIDYSFTGLGESSVSIITGVFHPNATLLDGLLDESAPGGPRLTIPIAGAATLIHLQAGTLSLGYEGTIVATAVPEASSLTLAAVGALCLAFAAAKRASRRSQYCR